MPVKQACFEQILTTQPLIKQENISDGTEQDLMKRDSDKKSKAGRRPDGEGPSVTPFPAALASASTSKPAKNDPLGDIPSTARRLIAAEMLLASDSSPTAAHAAFQVCEKMRRPLSILFGAVGFRSLFSRALTLAKAEVPWLRGVELGADSALEFSPEMTAQLESNEATDGGTALIVQLLGLLITFIGEALTRRLVYNVWPTAATNESTSKESPHEKST